MASKPEDPGPILCLGPPFLLPILDHPYVIFLAKPLPETLLGHLLDSFSLFSEVFSERNSGSLKWKVNFITLRYVRNRLY